MKRIKGLFILLAAVMFVLPITAGAESYNETECFTNQDFTEIEDSTNSISFDSNLCDGSNIEPFSYPLARTRISGPSTFTTNIYPNKTEKYYKMWYENNSSYPVTIGLNMNGKRVRNVTIGGNQSGGLVGDFTIQHRRYYNQNFQYTISSSNGSSLNGYATFRTENYAMRK